MSSVKRRGSPLANCEPAKRARPPTIRPTKKRKEAQEIVSLLARSQHLDFRNRPKYTEVRDIIESLTSLKSKPSGTIDLKEKQKRHEDWMRKGKKLFGKVNAPLHILYQHMKFVENHNKNCFDLSDKPRTPVEPPSRCATPKDDEERNDTGRDVFCFCRQREADMMVECGLCHEWYHCKCLKTAPSKIKDVDNYSCPICDWRVKIPRDAARPKLEDLQNWAAEMEGLPFQPEEEGVLKSIIQQASDFREILKPYLNPIAITTLNPIAITTPEILTQTFWLRKIEGAEILLAYETNFFRQELHRTNPVTPNPPPIMQESQQNKQPPIILPRPASGEHALPILVQTDTEMTWDGLNRPYSGSRSDPPIFQLTFTTTPRESPFSPITRPPMNPANDPAVDVIPPPDHELFADVNFDGGALTSWQFPFPTGRDDLARPVHQNGLPLEPLTSQARYTELYRSDLILSSHGDFAPQSPTPGLSSISVDADPEVPDEEEEEEHVKGEGEKTAGERRAEKRRMKRFRLTHNQTRFLMSEFTRQAHPDAAHRERLSKKIPGLSPRQVQVWFQKRRAKNRPKDVDMTQALHSPYGGQQAMGTPLGLPVTYLPYGEAGLATANLNPAYDMSKQLGPEHCIPKLIAESAAHLAHQNLQSGISATIHAVATLSSYFKKCLDPMEVDESKGKDEETK